MKGALVLIATLLSSAIAWGQNDTIHRAYFHHYDTTIRHLRFTQKWKDPINYKYTSKAWVVLEDNFNDDRNKWTVDPRDAIVKLGDGKLRLKVKGKEIRGGCAISDSFDFSRDFEIETWLKIDKLDGKGTPSASIFWGLDSLYGSSRITINRSQEINITHCKGGDHTKDTGKSFYAYFRKKTYHKFTIRRIGENYYFFVDDIFEKKLPFEPLPGHHISLAVEPNTEVFFDFLGVYYLN